jgi:UDP-N-acetylmuramate: L-alanyl-gamma-D-glutamyl-meso-diaminopimelate ligase
MEWVDAVQGIDIYDDFAHHPTAIRTTLEGARKAFPNRRIIAAIDPRSNTMRQGIHRETLVPAAQAADQIFIHCPEQLSWKPAISGKVPVVLETSVDGLLQSLVPILRSGDLVISMSNGHFEHLPRRLAATLKERQHV